MNSKKLLVYLHNIFLLLFLTTRKMMLDPGIYTGTIFVAPFPPPSGGQGLAATESI